MRILFALALPASCAPAAPPQAEIVTRPELEPLAVRCTAEGEVMLEYESELIATGRPCETRERQNYDDWLAARERGA